MKIAFNSSMPRSGSTLLQNILAQNPRFYCTPTSGIFDLLCVAREYFSRSPEVQAQDMTEMRNAFRGFCVGALEGFHRGLTDRPVCIDKSRGWLAEYDWLKYFQPEAKVLVMVRDLRAILSSMEKKWRDNPDKNRPEMKIDPHRMKMARIEGRVSHWMSSAPVGSVLMQLLGAIERGDHRRMHIIRFEDLTTQPQPTLDAIYDYLEEPRFIHDFARVEQQTHENDALLSIYGDHAIRQEVKPVPLDYHEILGRGLSAAIKDSNSAFYSTFYPGR